MFNRTLSITAIFLANTIFVFRFYFVHAKDLNYWEEKYSSRDLDVVIIGAGIVGLSTGISLLEKITGLRILILEDHQSYGVTSHAMLVLPVWKST
ncbi:MAG: FAD-dependent oxidoreductase [Saprospiraceae bacterium]